MKKLVWLLVLVLLLSGCSVKEPEETQRHYTHDIYELTFKTRKISNNHVGNEWSFTYTYNGETIKSGHRVAQSVEVFSFQPIQVEIREDDKIDDVGTGTMSVAFCDGGSGKTQITVTEKGGKFEGNTAVWEVTCEVKLVGKQ